MQHPNTLRFVPQLFLARVLTTEPVLFVCLSFLVQSSFIGDVQVISLSTNLQTNLALALTRRRIEYLNPVCVYFATLAP